MRPSASLSLSERLLPYRPRQRSPAAHSSLYKDTYPGNSLPEYLRIKFTLIFKAKAGLESLSEANTDETL